MTTNHVEEGTTSRIRGQTSKRSKCLVKDFMRIMSCYTIDRYGKL